MDGEVCRYQECLEMSCQKHKTGLQKNLFTGLGIAITWMGMAILAVIAIPTALLFLLLTEVWKVTDFFASECKRKGRR